MSLTHFSDQYIFKSFQSDKYQLLEKIGEGGFGKVFKARQINTGQAVALKFLALEPQLEASKKQRYVERFNRETLLCSRLNHPNIVRLLDKGQLTDELMYGVFEYVEGQTLRDVLRQEGAMDAVQATDLMLQVLDALIHAHQQGVIHRDIKPTNIMLSCSGAKTYAKILDFGIGTFAQESRQHDFETLTLTQETLGTPSYSAPEQLRGEPASAKSDLYVWGLVLLECLTGVPAVTGSSVASIYHKQLSDVHIPIPSALLGHPLAGLLRRVLHKSALERVITATEAFAELTKMNVSNLVGVLSDIKAQQGYDETTVMLRSDDPEHRTIQDYTALTERKQLTVLAVRLSVKALDNRDKDFDVIDTIYKSQRNHFIDIATRYGAYHVGNLADTSLFYFGYPLSSDNDTRLSARTALEMISELAKRNALMQEAHGVAINAHIGLHSGVFITYANAVPEGYHATVATALSREAGERQILCSAESRSLLDPYSEFNLYGQLQFPPMFAPSPVYNLQGERRVEAFGFMRGTKSHHQLVGRQNELEQTLSLLNEQAVDSSRIAHIHGEAGIGKSRLLQEIRSKASQYQHLVAQCLPEHQNNALYPILTLVKYLFNTEVLNAHSAHSLFTEVLRNSQHSINMTQVLPVLLVWLDIELSDDIEPSPLPPEEQKQALFKGLTALLLSNQHGLSQFKLCIIEDIHWADSTTLDFLKYFAAEITRGNVLLSTSRQALPSQLQDHTLVDVCLKKLTEQATEEFIVNLFDGRQLSAPLLKLLISRTDGIPLFIEELVNMLKQKALVGDKGGIVDFLTPDKLDQVPSSLRESLQQKLDNLTHAKETAQLAATIGREFEYNLLVAASPLSESQVQNDLNALMANDLIVHQRRVDNDSYIFKHALVKDAAIESIPAALQTKLYQTLANLLLNDQHSTLATRISLPLQAKYFIGAELIEPGINALITAGNDQNQKGAYQEALNLLLEAEELYIKHQQSKVDPALRIYLALAHSLSATLGFSDPQVEAYYNKINALDLSVASPELELAAHFVSSVFGIVTCQHDMTQHALDNLSVIAEKSEGQHLKVPVLFQQGQFATVKGMPEQGFAYLNQSLSVYDAKHRQFYNELIAYDIEVAIRVYGALNAAQLSQPQTALNWLEHALELAEEINNPHTSAHSYARASQLFILLKQPQQALEYAELALHLAEQNGLQLWLAFAKCFKAWSLAVLKGQSQEDDVIEMFAQGADFLTAVGLKSHALWLQALKSEMLYNLGQRQLAGELIATTVNALTHSDEKLYDQQIYAIKDRVTDND